MLARFSPSEFATAEQCATEGQLVGMLEVRADREAARGTRHPHPVTNEVGCVYGVRGLMMLLPAARGL